jgi:hypothetical protein
MKKTVGLKNINVMEMANYIYSILKRQLNVMWSWGFNSPKSISNGLLFRVSGFKHKGFVSVTYNEGKDLFDITLYDKQMVIVKKIESVFFDELVEIIDEAVERVTDYENRVKQEYSLL